MSEFDGMERTHAWRLTDEFADLRRTYMNNAQALHLLDQTPNWSDTTIAKWAHTFPEQVRALRYMRVGAVPNVPHNRLLWLLGTYAEFYGHHSHNEMSIPLGGRRRAVPDLVICRGHVGPPAFVVEIKTRMRSEREVTEAAEQVLRYHELIGEGTPVVCAYDVPGHLAHPDVKVWSASRLRREIRSLPDAQLAAA